MNISDPIADMLTRVRNASRARHTEVVVPASRTKREIARILKDEGFIADVTEEQDGAAHGPAPDPEVRRRQGPGRLRPQAHQQAGPARVCAQDRHPAGARRPRHRHRQHEQGHHDRPTGAAGPARRRSPGVRLVGGNDVAYRTPAHRRPVGCRRDDRRAPGHGEGAQGQPDPHLAPGHARQPGGRLDWSSPGRRNRRPTSSSTV